MPPEERKKIERRFEGGEMIVTMPNGKERKLNQQKLEKRIEGIQANLARVQGWLDQAKASA